VEELLETHVSKEDTVLFPMARQVLSEREIDEIQQVFEEVAASEGPCQCCQGSVSVSLGR
jgi:hemerythrin-like domain-containing protein